MVSEEAAGHPLSNEPPLGSGDHEEGDDLGRGMMTLEGLAHIYENNAFNASRELVDMSGDMYKIAAKADITPRERDLYMRMIASLQLERMGRLDEEELILAHMAMGVAINGQRARDIVTIATGAAQLAKQAGENLRSGVRGAWNRAKRW